MISKKVYKLFLCFILTHILLSSCRTTQVPHNSNASALNDTNTTQNNDSKQKKNTDDSTNEKQYGESNKSLVINKNDSGTNINLNNNEDQDIESLFDSDNNFDLPLNVKKATSKNAIDKNIIYGGKKGFLVDINNKVTSFLGEGVISVPEDKITLSAYRIKFSWDKNLLTSLGKKDPNNKSDIMAPPLLVYQNNKYLAKKILYNVKSEKAYANNIITPQKQGIIQANKFKKTNKEHFYVEDGSFSTCRLENPHYKIIAKRAKIIKDDRVITGPFYMKFGNVPTPLGFIYSAFRITDKRESGFVFPDVGFKSVKGFFINDFGYYFAINKYLGWAFLSGFDSDTGDIYFKSPFEYHIKNLLAGNINYQLKLESNRDIHILSWKHQTTKKRGGKLTADVLWKYENVQKSYDSREPEQESENSTNADLNYYIDNIFGIPYSFDFGLHHDKKFGRKVRDIYGNPKPYANQSLDEKESEKDRTRIIIPSITLSSVPFYIFNPFGNFSPNIFTNVNIAHSVEFKYEKNKIYNFLDFIKNIPKSLSDGKIKEETHYGILQTFPISTSSKIFKYFNLTPSFVWRERWYFEKFRHKYDAIKREVVIQDMTRGFYRVGDYSLGTSIETNIESRYLFSENSKINGIRHKITPSLNFSFSPGFGQDNKGHFQKVYNYYDNKIESKYRYDNLYGAPSSDAQALLSLNLKNVVDCKINDRVSKTKKLISILKSFDVKIQYDFLAEKYKLKNIEFFAASSFFDEHVNLKLSAEIDPYIYKVVNGEMEKIDEYAWNHGKKLGEFRKGTLDAEFILKPENEQEIQNNNYKSGRYVNFDIPWNLRANYHIVYHKESYLEVSERLRKENKIRLLDPNKKIEPYDKIVEHNVKFDGEVNLTKKWKFAASVLYNIKKTKFEDPTISIFRDLHCWELRINWRPLYYRESLEFLLRIKADILKFIKYKSKGKM